MVEPRITGSSCYMYVTILVRIVAMTAVSMTGIPITYAEGTFSANSGLPLDFEDDSHFGFQTSVINDCSFKT